MSLPDYVTDANAVMKDDTAKWRHGKAPDYTKTRQVWAESRPQPPPSILVSVQQELTDPPTPRSQEDEP